jgi:hypothetical protein
VVLVRVFFLLSLFEARTMQTEADSEAGSNGRPFVRPVGKSSYVVLCLFPSWL